MDISLFMSAARPKWWQRMYESLLGNKCDWEIVAVGPNVPKWQPPKNFRYMHSKFKPCQCYAIASHYTTGELIGYTADDAVYTADSLDKIWETYKATNNTKAIFTQSTIENGKDVSEEHHFFRHCKNAPQMAPMAFLNREWFFKIGAYDRNFVSGQSENDVVMRAFEDGGRIINVPESKVYLNHEEVHGGFINKIQYRLGKNSFRTGYFNDRRYLEECWVKNGYGTYNEETLRHGEVSKTRLLPVQSYDYKNILNVAQGPQGRWGNI